MQGSFLPLAPLQISFPYGMLIPSREVRWTGAMVLGLIAVKSRALITSCSLEAASILAKEPCQSGGRQPGGGTVSRLAAGTAGPGRLTSRQRASPRRPCMDVVVIGICVVLPKRWTAWPSFPLGAMRKGFVIKGVISGNFYGPCNKTSGSMERTGPLPTCIPMEVLMGNKLDWSSIRHFIRRLGCKWKDHTGLSLLPSLWGKELSQRRLDAT